MRSISGPLLLEPNARQSLLGKERSEQRVLSPLVRASPVKVRLDVLLLLVGVYDELW